MADNEKTATNENTENLIDYKAIVNYIFEELKSRNLLHKEISTYKATESLLYKYNDLKESIKNREEEITEIQKYGLRGKSKSIFKIPDGGHIEPDDIEQDVINGLIKDIKRTQVVINRVDRILKKFKADKYIEIIKLKYFDKKTQQEISDYFAKDPVTIWRNNKRLINEIKVYFFPNDVISEITSA